MSKPLSEHFSWEEAIRSSKADELGLVNLPDSKATGNIIVTASKLEEVRALVGPLIISSWYRSPAVNKAIGGVSTSAHTTGCAVDCHSASMTPLELCKKVVASGIRFDQIIHEYGTWMHISFDERMRGMLLTKFDRGYIEGLLTEAQYARKK
jgi:putative chitinase